MRGRRPRPIEIAPHDRPILQQIAHSQIRPWYQVRRARILLGIAAGARTQTLALQTQCDESTVRRTCHRYRRLGLSGLLDSPTRSGRPIAISPPATRPDRRAGLPGAGGRGLAYHSLDQ
jgi:antitoxin (DNA-binding transcriptional repressor) of toxin-antitoxin stability system